MNEDDDENKGGTLNLDDDPELNKDDLFGEMAVSSEFGYFEEEKKPLKIFEN